MMTYLDYYKNILTKVSFDPHLFHKEYRKATRDLHAQEVSDLNKWLSTTEFYGSLAKESNSEATRCEAGYD